MTGFVRPGALELNGFRIRIPILRGMSQRGPLGRAGIITS